jgi:DNA-binding response OmpR family regulator
MVVDDDLDFVSVLTEVFTAQNGFKVVKTFNSLAEFAKSVPPNNDEAQSYLPDLLVLDVMSSDVLIKGGSHLDGATVATMLRNAGLQFAVLLLSSMKSHHFEIYGHRKNWEFLRKTSRLSPAEIIRHAQIALGENGLNQ